MSPDPFRALDRIDPPDQWDEIARRTASDELAVDLDASRLVRPRRRAAVLVAAAAAVALVAGIAVAGADRGGDDALTTATDPTVPDDGDDDDGAVDQTTSTAPPVIDIGGPCPFTLVGDGIPAPEAVDIPRTEGELPDVVRTSGQTTVDGHLVTVVLGGLPMLEAPMFAPIGNLEVHTGGGPAGTTRVSGIEALPTEPPCQDLQSWIDVPADQVDAATEVIERVLTAVVPAEPLDEADRQIRIAARARLAARQAETERCETDGACVPMSWEGPTVEGGTYRIEVDQDVIRGFIDGQQINTNAEVPVWEDIAGGTVMGAVGFERSPQPATMSQDMIVVGARPPGAAETFLVDPEGNEIDAATLTVSPDGRFYAIHALELTPGGPGTPWPVHHRNARGAVIEQPAGG